ncbi:hypothetical protein [Anatilimnocola floriformis]|uniref:hypothetical protein n=1 Tax=Anatilimnocola floriformis TaxID=2948575 RepID=UPI0020C308EA|nr:hypothetical protein [Anatilimnocola floriformis]
MLAWAASRLAGAAVRLAGGSPDAVDTARVSVGALLAVVDPVGGAAALGHAAISAEARNGNPAAKVANAALTVGSILSGGLDLPTDEFPDTEA